MRPIWFKRFRIQDTPKYSMNGKWGFYVIVKSNILLYRYEKIDLLNEMWRGGREEYAGGWESKTGYVTYMFQGLDRRQRWRLQKSYLRVCCTIRLLLSIKKPPDFWWKKSGCTDMAVRYGRVRLLNGNRNMSERKQATNTKTLKSGKESRQSGTSKDIDLWTWKNIQFSVIHSVFFLYKNLSW